MSAEKKVLTFGDRGSAPIRAGGAQSVPADPSW